MVDRIERVSRLKGIDSGIGKFFERKEGYEDSETKSAVISVGGAVGKKGDVNMDGIVNGTDIQEVINIIVNEE